MDRLDKILEYKNKLRTDCRGYYIEDGRVNLLEDPEFSQASYMIRKGKLVEETLKRVKVRIFPGELIVGTFLETWVRVISNTLEERRKYGNMNHAYPRRNNRKINGQRVYSSSPLFLTEEELRNPDSSRWNWGHTCGGFERILTMGYEGIAREAERKIEEMESSGHVDVEKKEFWEAVILSVRAVCALSERYAEELDVMASVEEYGGQSERAAELRIIAGNMRHVPAQPARTFWEALQSCWFAWMCSIRFNGTDLGRFDQYIYPYYKHDLDAGIITKEKAEELIQCFFLKCDEHYIANPTNAGLGPAIMLGGLKPDGKDGTNEITFMCMRATERFSIPTPKISVRINEQTPDEVFETAHRMLLKGINQPDFYADRVIIPAYERIGIPFEDAVQYAQATCEELSLAGISEDCTNEGPHCDLHDKVELAMQRVVSGEKAETFDRFMEMVEEEIRKCIQEEIAYHLVQTEKLRIFSPQPLHSAAIVGCLESGKDIMAGGAKYNNTGSVLGGLATAADGLYAIKKLVYEEQRLTIEEFHRILVDNYEGNEFLRLEILNKFPKFGNDDDRVDSIAIRLFDVYAEELEKQPNSRGGIYKIGAWASEYRSSYMATPDGRRKGDNFAVNISPTPGRDIKGITAVIRSGTKLNMGICSAGSMLDMAMNPTCISGENGVEILKQIVTSYGVMGGGGLQFNIMDAKTLREAQENPMKYKNLMVRVWGYNDYFVSLPKEKQENVIARTIHNAL